MRKTGSIIILLLLLFQLLIVFVPPETNIIQNAKASLTPSSGWQWVRQLNISNAVDDYQIKLRLYENDPSKDDPANGTIDLAGHCKNFPNDIRFGTTNDPSTAEQLPQWIEHYGSGGGGLEGISYNSSIFSKAYQGVAMDSEYLYGISAEGITVTKISDEKSIKAGFQYDADKDSYTDYTDEINSLLNNDVELLPSPPAVGDAFYFGLYNKFTALYINIGTAGSNITITWKYWNGESWTNLPNVTDNNFTTSGGNWVYWNRPSDWQQNTVNGVTAYWVKAEVTSVGSSPSQPKANYAASGRYCANDRAYTGHLSDGHVLQHGSSYYLYIAACNYPSTPKIGAVYKYKLAGDPDEPLDYVGVVKDFTSENCPGYLSGVDKYEVDGTTYWWVTFDVDSTSSSNPSQVWRYDYNPSDDTDWANKTVYNLGYYHSGYNIQGFTWWEDNAGNKYIFCPIHEGSSPATIDVYKWNGNGFDNYAQYSYIQSPDGDKSSQGVCRDFSSSDYLYFASRQGVYGRPILKADIEQSSTPPYVDIWVKLPSNNPDTIYLFAGNSGANEYNDGDATFLFFDDFNTNTSSEYTIDSGTWNWDTANSVLQCTGSSTGLIHHSTFSMTTGMSLMVKQRTDTVNSNSHTVGNVFAFQDTGNFYHGRLNWDADNFYCQAYKWVSSSATKLGETSFSSSANTWYVVESAWVSSSEFKVFVDGVEKLDVTSGLESWTSGKIGARVYKQTTFTDEFDWIIVRKYADPEPTWSSFGSWTPVGGANSPPQLSNENPPNGSTNQPTSLTWSVYISDPEGDTFNWTIKCSNGQSASGTDDTNGTKSLSLTGLAYNTNYTVWVNATDSGSGEWTNATYWFVTASNSPPTQSNPSPPNGATDVDVSLSQLSVDISDPEGDLMNWTIETSPNIGSASGNNAGNGTITCSVSGLQYNTTYIWYVNVTDGNSWTNESYTFTTVSEPTLTPPTITATTPQEYRKINVSWSGGSGNYTVIVFSDSDVTSLDDGFIYYFNTSDGYEVFDGLASNRRYNASAWSGNGSFTIVKKTLEDGKAVRWLNAYGIFKNQQLDGTGKVNGTYSMKLYNSPDETVSTFYRIFRYCGSMTEFYIHICIDNKTSSNQDVLIDLYDYDTGWLPEVRFMGTGGGGDITTNSGLTTIFNNWVENRVYNVSFKLYPSIDKINITINDYNGNTSYVNLSASGAKKIELVTVYVYNNDTVWIDNWVEPRLENTSNSYTTAYNYTYPYKILNFKADRINSTHVNLTWSLPTNDAYNYGNIVIRKSNTTYPSTPNDGTLVYNGTGTDGYYIDTSSVDEPVYYSAWGYGVDSGYYSLDSATTSLAGYPFVRTNESTGVEETNASLHGYLEHDGGEPCTVWFEWGTTTSYGNTTPSESNKTSPYEFSYNLTGLSPGILYHYRAIANNSADTDYGDDKTFFTKPYAPSDLTATSINTSAVSLSWSKGEGADKTMIVRKTGSYPTSISDGVVVYNDTGTSYTDTGLSAGTGYYYRAWSYAEDSGLYQYSDGYASAMNYTYPDKPTSISSSTTPTSITLSWTKGDGADYTVIRYSTSGYPSSLSEGTLAYNDTGTSTTISGLTPDTTYYFSFWAYDSESGYYSQEYVTHTTTTPYVPPDPSNLVATTVNDTQISLTWSASTDVNSVLVRKVGGYPSSPSDGTVAFSSSGTSYVDTGLTPSTHYYYRVWTYNQGVYSENYAEDETWTKPQPPQDVGYNLEANGTTANLTITWTKGQGADKTVIRKSADSFPSSPSDGTLVYNGTGESYTDVNIDQTWYYRLWSYNETSGLYSEGVNLTFFACWLNCYNESSGEAIENWSVFISDMNGSQVYTAEDLQNSHILNVSQIPSGLVSFKFTADGYMFRLYYYEVTQNSSFTINAYLPPESANPTLYLIYVKDVYDSPIRDALISVRHYDPSSSTYVEVARLYTDAEGRAGVYLIPNDLYKLVISKDGYQTGYFDYVPLAEVYTAEFTLLGSGEGVELPEGLWDNITLSIQPSQTHFNTSVNLTVYFNISCSTGELEWYKIEVYRIRNLTQTEILLYSYNESNPYGGNLSYNIGSEVGTYKVVCTFKKQNFSAVSFERLYYTYEEKLPSLALIPPHVYVIILIFLALAAMAFLMKLGAGDLSPIAGIIVFVIGFLVYPVTIAGVSCWYLVIAMGIGYGAYMFIRSGV